MPCRNSVKKHMPVTEKSITEQSTVKLRRVLVRPFGDEYFRVMRWGGNSKIVTRQVGIDALRQFEQGRTVGEVQSCLAGWHGAEARQVNLHPLIQSLASADLIAKIDGAPVPVRRRVTVATLAKFIGALYGTPALRAIAARLRPVAAARAAMAAIEQTQMRKAFLPDSRPDGAKYGCNSRRTFSRGKGAAVARILQAPDSQHCGCEHDVGVPPGRCS